jgi:hypothetical protein
MLINNQIVTNVLHNVTLVSLPPPIVSSVKPVELILHHLVHVQMDKLTLMEFVTTVNTDVLPVPVLPLIVILVLIQTTELKPQIVYVKMNSMMMVILPIVTHVYQNVLNVLVH